MPEKGAFQQYTLADVRMTTKIPAPADFDSVSSFPVAGNTAAAIQLAVLSGLEAITTSSPAHFAYLKSLGATTVIDRSAADVAAQILAVAGGTVKYVVDSISLPPTQLLAVEILQPRGKLVLVLPLIPALDPCTKAAADSKEIALLGTYGATGFYQNGRFWDSVEGYLERGLVKFDRPTIFPGGLRAWEEGFNLHRQGKVTGRKVVMRLQETNDA
ncbi:hypothetical protein C8R44DRAFT_893002 [Mycena epipterygia]|nr:hypothetical protein C8R44DRAFT_893002 [Mycena epipterygia]